MTVALLLGIAAGAGGWLVVVALRPPPAPLATVLAELWDPAPTSPTRGAGGRLVAWTLRALSTVGVRTPATDQQLALAGRTPEQWARDKLVGAVAGLAAPLTIWAALSAVGIALPPVVGLLPVAGAAGGWMLADLRLRDQVADRRKAFRYALSAYLDLVNVILAGGGGIETALVAAAEAGDGWVFAELRTALENARRSGAKLWTAFDELGGRLGVTELSDLASSLELAGTQGARVRASLAVKADTLRAHQIAETETAAEATTERMNLPTAVLLLGFLVFIVFPAVTAITATARGGCLPHTSAAGTGDCPDLETESATLTRSNP